MNIEKNSITAQTTLLFVLFFILLAAIAGLGIMVYSLNEKLQVQQEILLKIPPELQSKILAAFQNSADMAKGKVIEIHNAASASIKTDVKQRFSLQESLLQKQMAQIIANQNQLQPELAKLNRNIESVVQINNKNHENAEAAILLAKKAVESGEIQLAMVYALNAINHESSNTEYLKFYHELLTKKKDLAISEIDHFISVLDLAVFQINASDVPSIVAIKTALMEKRSSLVSAIAEAKSKEVAAQVEANIAELRTGRLALTKIVSDGKVDETLLKERLEVLTALLADASITQKDRNVFTEDLRYATGLYSISSTLSAAKNAVAKAGILAKKGQLQPTEILAARNQLQTGNTLLAQIWSSENNKYQEFVAKALKLQADISAIDKKLNLIASEPAKIRIEKLVAECKKIAQGNEKFTIRINKITEKTKEFPHLLSSIYDPDLRKMLTTSIESLSPIVSSLSKDRYKAYQNWAVERLNAARKKWAKEIRWTSTLSGSKKDIAQALFNDYLLEINPGLLLPDVNSLYNSLYQLFYNEFSDKAGMQYRKAIYRQVKQLEDF